MKFLLKTSVIFNSLFSNRYPYQFLNVQREFQRNPIAVIQLAMVEYKNFSNSGDLNLARSRSFDPTERARV